MVIILMGVSGAGKTTIGQLLARELGWKFYEGDEFHSTANIDKMKRGIALTDEDRIPWLKAIKELISRCLDKNENAIIACSALKKSYREYLLKDHEGVTLIYLKGDHDLLQKRLEKRQGHFFNQELLASQFDTLEEPTDALPVDVSEGPEAVVESIRRELI